MVPTVGGSPAPGTPGATSVGAPAPGTPGGGSNTTNNESEAEKKKKLLRKEAGEVWRRWLEGTLKEGQAVDQTVLKEAAIKIVGAGIMSVQDSVGLESADLADFPGWTDLSMSARALVKRGIAIAQEVHGNSCKSDRARPVATPLRSASVRTEAVMNELCGRAASEAAVEKAVMALEDATWTVQSLLEKKGLKGLSFTMVPDREVWAAVKAEVAQAASEGQHLSLHHHLRPNQHHHLQQSQRSSLPMPQSSRWIYQAGPP